MPTRGALSPEYIAYLNSATWEGKRQAALKRAGHACQVCNAGSFLDVHHRTYERFGGGELARDLTVLCRPCHDLFHANRFVKKGNLPQDKPKAKTKAKKKKRKSNKVYGSCVDCGRSTSKGRCKPCKAALRRSKRPRVAKTPAGRKSSLTVKRDPQPAGKLTKKQRQLLALQVKEALENRNESDYASNQSRKSKAKALAAKSGSALERPDVQAK